MTASDGTPDLASLLAEPRHRVSPRAKGLWFTKALLETVALLALVGVWAYFDPDRRAVQLWVGGVLAAVGIASLVVEPWWRYRVHRWDVTDLAVLTRSGWLTQERRVAPLSRVQTVDVERGPFAQLFGLANVTVTTASAKGPVVIEGLALTTAEELVERLTRVASLGEGDAT